MDKHKTDEEQQTAENAQAEAIKAIESLLSGCACEATISVKEAKERGYVQPVATGGRCRCTVAKRLRVAFRRGDVDRVKVVDNGSSEYWYKAKG